jgi:hypothetical protein
MSGRIRLACLLCEREDCDGIDEIPADWYDVDEFQSYESSVEEIPVEDQSRSPLEWHTHLGVCPECAKIAGYLDDTKSASNTPAPSQPDD